MSDKFNNKYRIPSARLRNWDYGSNAIYFVTICTQNREHYFGEIENGEMILSEIGNMAKQCWIDIPNHFPFVELTEFVVMPNHVHGIIIIDKPVETQHLASLNSGNDASLNSGNDASLNSGNDASLNSGNDASLNSGNDASLNSGNDASINSQNTISLIETQNDVSVIETQNIASLPKTSLHAQTQNVASLPQFGPQSQNLASIVRGFKIGVTKFARNNHFDFAWQPRFHDHIIRNEESFQHIKNYIASNPAKWQDDKFYQQTT